MLFVISQTEVRSNETEAVPFFVEEHFCYILTVFYLKIALPYRSSSSTAQEFTVPIRN